MGGTIIAKPSDPSKMGGGNDGVPSGSEEWACRTHHEGGAKEGGRGSEGEGHPWRWGSRA